jgi:hypothetical protein
MFTMLDTNLWYDTALPYAPTDATLRIPLSYSIPGYVITKSAHHMFSRIFSRIFSTFFKGFPDVLFCKINQLHRHFLQCFRFDINQKLFICEINS